MPDCHPAELPIFFIPFEEHKKIELPDKDLVEIRDFFICKKCDARTNITSIPEKAHTEGQWSVISEPTFINVGQQVLKCSICDTVLKTESLPVTDHLFNNWETISAATYTNAGTEARTCSVCGTTETRVLAKLEKTSTSTTATPVLELNVKSLPLKVKQTFSGVEATSILPGDRIVKWKSSNTKIVTVKNNGKITSKKTGKATITCYTELGASASFKVTVQKIQYR